MLTDRESEPSAGGARATGIEVVGRRLRAERLRRDLSLRELARRAGVSASLLSQIETGRARPSIGTLYAVASGLGVPADELLSDAGEELAPAPLDVPLPSANGPLRSPVLRADGRRSIQIEHGVRWDRLTPEHDHDVHFLRVYYDVGGTSCPADALQRHVGREYGLVERGSLQVTLAFEHYLLGAGDSIAFDSSTPHRLANVGDEPVVATWVVVGRDEPAAP